MVWKTVYVVTFAFGALVNAQSNQLCALEKVINDFLQCLNIETVKREILENRPEIYKEGLKKYCAKSPQVKTCTHGLYARIAPCMHPSVKYNVSSVNHASDEIIDLFCYDHGTRVASFIEEGGIQCLQEKADQIEECPRKRTRNSGPPQNSDSFSFLANGCPLIEELQNCIVTVLRGCPTMAAANMADSLLTHSRETNACIVLYTGWL